MAKSDWSAFCWRLFGADGEPSPDDDPRSLTEDIVKMFARSQDGFENVVNAVDQDGAREEARKVKNSILSNLADFGRSDVAKERLLPFAVLLRFSRFFDIYSLNQLQGINRCCFLLETLKHPVCKRMCSSPPLPTTHLEGMSVRPTAAPLTPSPYREEWHGIFRKNGSAATPCAVFIRT